ncbi:plasmid recombination protein [Frisingicoccus sp.]|uniref:plasmid recombination protein n=1 Tax=Frisingicoccus sp. TaxID=1918627 RepID=UPI0039994DE2
MVGTGYLSFDASVKIHASGRHTSTKTNKTGSGGISGYIRHIDRGTDRKNGCEVQHSNPDINPDFTLENESYYKDNNGVWKKTDQSKDMVKAITRRVKYAGNHGARISSKGQNDTVLVRPLVVQLDSDVISQHEETWVWDIIEIIEDTFGKDNVVGFSIHRDETNVHIHICFVPCYETEKNDTVKCTLSQTRFFKNPKQLASMHRKIRKSLLDKGYDIEQENKPIEEQLAGYTDKNGVWHQQGLTPEQLKQLSEKEIALQVKEIDMRLRKDEMDKLERAMRDIEDSMKSRQAELEQEQQTLAFQKTALESDKATVQEQIQALVKEKMDVEKSKKEANEMFEKACTVYQVSSRILEDEKNLNSKFLEFLDREGKRTGKQTRQYVEYLYKKFQKERRDSLSDWQLEMLQVRAEREQQDNMGDIPNIIDTGVGGYNLSL